ncbi:MAG: phosphate signaling complex protein PhoU [Lentisphaeria bacterium]|nr:phosphate signaling complex protein PhoU [Lentisphaeria bacterium]
MREQLEKEIVRLKRMVSSLASAVETAVQQAVAAAAEPNSEMAAAVITRDDAIDRTEITIEEECLKILALHQPVAGDLRYIITILKVNGELERIGDLAVNIARHTLDFANRRHEEIAEPIDFTEQVQLVRQMLKRALDALMSRNCLDANEVMRMDGEVDEINKRVINRAMELIAKHPENAAYYVDAMFISRHLERIGDCTTNICEDVIYLELGKIVRHSRLDELG